MTWYESASTLAAAITHPRSRWRGIVASTPRHAFVPHWWQRGLTGWERQDGPADLGRWHKMAYRDTSLITRVGSLHADHAEPADKPSGPPTCWATRPSLTVRLLQHARLADEDRLLDLGTGTGYSAALAARRLHDHQVMAVDVDPYLVASASESCAAAGVAPAFHTLDATADLPWTSEVDRIIAGFGVRPVPRSWLGALKPGGRLVATIAGTSLIITADKRPDGSAVGRVEWDHATSTPTRTTDGDRSPGLGALLATAVTYTGEEVTTGPYPVVDVAAAWDLRSMLELIAPGIEHTYRFDKDQHTALMVHADGSWARATAKGTEGPTVHQSGPRRLWSLLDECRTYGLTHGELPVRGARVLIRPGGHTTLVHDGWHLELT